MNRAHILQNKALFYCICDTACVCVWFVVLSQHFRNPTKKDTRTKS